MRRSDLLRHAPRGLSDSGCRWSASMAHGLLDHRRHGDDAPRFWHGMAKRFLMRQSALLRHAPRVLSLRLGVQMVREHGAGLLRHAPRVLSPTRGAVGPRAWSMDCLFNADTGLTSRVSGMAWRRGFYEAISPLTIRAARSIFDSWCRWSASRAHGLLAHRRHWDDARGFWLGMAKWFLMRRSALLRHAPRVSLRLGVQMFREHGAWTGSLAWHGEVVSYEAFSPLTTRAARLSPTRGADGPRAWRMDCWLIADTGMTRRVSGMALAMGQPHCGILFSLSTDTGPQRSARCMWRSKP
jgi:hypothetical protein